MRKILQTGFGKLCPIILTAAILAVTLHGSASAVQTAPTAAFGAKNAVRCMMQDKSGDQRIASAKF